MPSLLCTSDNNDPNSKVCLELNLFNQISDDKASWLNYEIIFHMGKTQHKFSSVNRQAITALGTVGEIGKFAFAIKPYNELEAFTKGILNFLKSDTQSSYRFEPADPSFELILERTIDPNEIKVHCWVDAGNTQQLVYTWDGLGLRFVTTKVSIEKFVESLTAIQ